MVFDRGEPELFPAFYLVNDAGFQGLERLFRGLGMGYAAWKVGTIRGKTFA